jgi:hypothetical protein
VTGTGDDTTITTYNRTNAATQILINNDPSLVQTYKGVEITATKRMSKQWQVLAGLTLSRSRQDNLSEAISTANPQLGAEHADQHQRSDRDRRPGAVQADRHLPPAEGLSRWRPTSARRAARRTTGS